MHYSLMQLSRNEFNDSFIPNANNHFYLNYFRIIFIISIFPDHVDEVRAIVQRAVKDVTIESALKTYEEIWLSKIFELRPHVRVIGGASSEKQDKEVGSNCILFL